MAVQRILSLWLVASSACGRIGFEPVVADDAAPAADASVSACSSAIFCSGFEDTGFGDWSSSVLRGSAELSQDATTAFRGGFAAREGG